MSTTTTRPAAGAAIVGVVERGGTAVLVTLGADGTLMDRRQIELVGPGLSTHPHHHEGSWAMGRYLSTPGARRLPLAEAVALVEEVRQAARRRAADALEALARESAVSIARMAIRRCPEMPASVEARIADHRVQTFADSVMYREVLAEAARARGWAVDWYDRDRVPDEAAAAVPHGVDVPAYLKAMGRAAGPPWTAEHRLAAAAALASRVAHESEVAPTIIIDGLAARPRSSNVHPEVRQYNAALAAGDKKICQTLARAIDRALPDAENKIWHRHPVWFLDGNPVVGYSKLKGCVRLLFWSGQSFDEDGLTREGTFKAAEARYTSVSEVDLPALERWLAKSREIQWDYKNIVRRKGKLVRIA